MPVKNVEVSVVFHQAPNALPVVRKFRFEEGVWVELRRDWLGYCNDRSPLGGAYLGKAYPSSNTGDPKATEALFRFEEIAMILTG